MFGPNPDAIHPNEKIPSICYIKNIITRPNIQVGPTPTMMMQQPAARTLNPM